MVPFGFEHRDASAAAGHHHKARLHHVPDGLDLHDGLGPGGGHHPAVAPSGVLHHLVVPLGHQLIGLLLGHEGPDGLGGVGEGRVLGVHLHLGKDGGHPLPDAPVQQLLPEGVLQIVADVALAHGHAHRQGAGDVFVRLGPGELRHGLLDHAHLGAVAVGEDHLVPVLDEVGDGPGGLLDGGHLLGEIIAQGVAAQGDDDALSHLILPRIIRFADDL